MPRKAPDDRFEQLVDAATGTFIARGYTRTQMADIAAAMGISKGALYLYAESKEALFDLAIRLADLPSPLAQPPKLPVPSPAAGATVEYVTFELAKMRVLRITETLLAKKKRGDGRAELELLVRELYDNLSRHAHALKLVHSSAKDLPELAAVWFDTARPGLVEVLTRYLVDRSGARLLRRVPDTRAAAHVIVETTMFWAVHSPWDAHARATASVAEETAVHFALGALTRG